MNGWIQGLIERTKRVKKWMLRYRLVGEGATDLEEGEDRVVDWLAAALQQQPQEHHRDLIESSHVGVHAIDLFPKRCAHGRDW